MSNIRSEEITFIGSQGFSSQSLEFPEPHEMPKAKEVTSNSIKTTEELENNELKANKKMPEDLAAKVAELETLLANSKKANADLTAENTTLTTLLANSKKANEDLVQQNATLNTLVENGKIAFAVYQEREMRFKGKLLAVDEVAKKHLLELAAKVEVAEDTNKDLHFQIQTLEAAKRNSDSHVQSLESDKRQLQSDIAHLNTQIEELHVHIRSLEADKRQLAAGDAQKLDLLSKSLELLRERTPLENNNFFARESEHIQNDASGHISTATRCISTNQSS